MTSKVYHFLFLGLLFRSSSGFYFGIPADNRNDKQFIYQTPGNTNRFGRQMPPHHEPDAVIINVGGNQPGIPGGYPSFDFPNGPDVYGRPQGPPVFGMPGGPNVFGGPRGPGVFGIPGGRGGPGVFGIPNGQNGPGVFGIPNGQGIPGGFGNPGGPSQPGNPNMFGAPGAQGFGWGFAGGRLPMPNGGKTFLIPSVPRSLDGLQKCQQLAFNSYCFIPLVLTSVLVFSAAAPTLNKADASLPKDCISSSNPVMGSQIFGTIFGNNVIYINDGTGELKCVNASTNSMFGAISSVGDKIDSVFSNPRRVTDDFPRTH